MSNDVKAIKESLDIIRKLLVKYDFIQGMQNPNNQTEQAKIPHE